MNWDYVAGLFDGEGSIQIRDYPNRSRGRGISLIIGITDGQVLDQLQSFLLEQNISSHVYHRTILRGKERKPCQWWQISNKWDATLFLEAIKDKAIVKRQRVLEALEFRQTLKTFTRPFTKEELEEIRSLHLQGKTGLEISKVLGCGRSKVTKAFAQLGIKGSRRAWGKHFKGRKYPDAPVLDKEDVLIFSKA